MSRDGHPPAAGLSDREEGTPASVGGAANRAMGSAVDRRVSFVRQEFRSEFYFLFPFSDFNSWEWGIRSLGN